LGCVINPYDHPHQKAEPDSVLTEPNLVEEVAFNVGHLANSASVHSTWKCSSLPQRANGSFQSTISAYRMTGVDRDAPSALPETCRTAQKILSRRQESLIDPVLALVDDCFGSSEMSR
jgi:hypothetical protein